MAESNGFPLHPLRQRRSRVPDRPDKSVNLWNVMKNFVGKDIIKLPCPVNFMEPLSFLQVSSKHWFRGLDEFWELGNWDLLLNKVTRNYGLFLHPALLVNPVIFWITLFRNSRKTTSMPTFCTVLRFARIIMSRYVTTQNKTKLGKTKYSRNRI